MATARRQVYSICDLFWRGDCDSAHFSGCDTRREEVLELVDLLQGLSPSATSSTQPRPAASATASRHRLRLVRDLGNPTSRPRMQLGPVIWPILAADPNNCRASLSYLPSTHLSLPAPDFIKLPPARNGCSRAPPGRLVLSRPSIAEHGASETR